MSYVNGYVIPVPEGNIEKYRLMAEEMGKVSKEHGALKIFECLEDNVPDGEVTSFPLAVKRQLGEKVIFAFTIWSSKEASETGMKKVMDDPRVASYMQDMPFDGQRMIWGNFKPIVEM